MVDVAGGGHLVVWLETTHGTYLAPTVFCPIESESLQEDRQDKWSSAIIGRAVTTGKLKGKESVSGSITMELLPETFVYFLIASRWGNNLAKTGSGPYVYTANDDAAAHVKTNFRSLTIGVDRAGIGFTYIGCQATGFRFFWDDSVAMVEVTIVGREQTEDYAPGAVTAPAQVPFGGTETSLTIASSARTDLDSLEVSFDDAGEAKMNITSQAGADYIKYGEHVAEATFEIDFESKADYAIWVARTVQEILITITSGATAIITIELHGALYDTFEVPLSGMADQVKATATLRAAYVSGDTAASEIIVTTPASIALS